jgi:hypothetical protein
MQTRIRRKNCRPPCSVQIHLVNANEQEYQQRNQLRHRTIYYVEKTYKTPHELEMTIPFFNGNYHILVEGNCKPT